MTEKKTQDEIGVVEAAAMIGVSAQTIYNWTAANRHQCKLPRRKDESDRIWFRRDDVKLFTEWYWG